MINNTKPYITIINNDNKKTFKLATFYYIYVQVISYNITHVLHMNAKPNGIERMSRDRIKSFKTQTAARTKPRNASNL